MRGAVYLIEIMTKTNLLSFCCTEEYHDPGTIPEKGTARQDMAGRL